MVLAEVCGGNQDDMCDRQDAQRETCLRLPREIMSPTKQGRIDGISMMSLTENAAVAERNSSRGALLPGTGVINSQVFESNWYVGDSL